MHVARTRTHTRAHTQALSISGVNHVGGGRAEWEAEGLSGRDQQTVGSVTLD